jgi:hypothetical protein
MTLEEFNRYLEHVFRKPTPRAQPTTTVDFDLLSKHKIGFCFHGPDLILFSSAGLKKAREVGAVKNLQ